MIRAGAASEAELKRRKAAFDGGGVVERIRGGEGNFGFDARTAGFVDLAEAGVIDPTKVVRTALENAVSVASILLLAEVTLTEIEEDHPASTTGYDST